MVVKGGGDVKETILKKLIDLEKVNLEDILECVNNKRENRKNVQEESFNKKRLYSVDEFRSEIMNNQISKATIYAKIRCGELKAIKIGKRPFIPSEVVEELLTSYV